MNTTNRLTKDAEILVENFPYIINRLAEKLNSMIDNWDPDAGTREEALEPIEIQHVGYDAEQCGREK